MPFKNIEESSVLWDFPRKPSWSSFHSNIWNFLILAACFVFQNLRRRLEYVCSSQDRRMGAVMEKSSRQNWNILFVTPSPPHRVFPPIFKSWNLQFLVKLPQNEKLRKFLPLFECESLTFGRSSDLFTIRRYNLGLIYLFSSLSNTNSGLSTPKNPSFVAIDFS